MSVDFATLSKIRSNDPLLCKVSLQDHSANHIKDFIALAAALAANRVIREVGVTSSQVSAAIVVSEVLKVNTTIKAFECVADHMDEPDTAAIALAGALQANATLQSFTLRVSDMSEAAGIVLAGALKANVTLQSFTLKDKDMPEAVEEIALAIQRNRMLPMHYSHLSAMAMGSAVPGVKEALGNARLLENVFAFFMPHGAAFRVPHALAAALASREGQVDWCGSFCASNAGSSLCQDGSTECQSWPTPPLVSEPVAEMPCHEDIDAEKQEGHLDENASIAEAILRSRCNPPPEGVPLSDDGVVVLRLTRKARSQQVAKIWSGSPLLAACHSRVAEAGGCSWSHAWMLVPISQEQFCEVGIELKDHHIVCLAADIANIRTALKEIRCTDRPGLTDTTDYDSDKDHTSPVDVEVEQYCALRTFSSFETPAF